MQESVLYDFSRSGADAGSTESGLLLDPTGTLFGASYRGGDSGCGYCGLIYGILPDGTESTVFTFCGFCGDGAYPHDRGGLVQDAAGNLYGTTAGESGIASATLFRLTGVSLTVLHTFSSGTATSGVTVSSLGEIFGTAQVPGSTNGGTVWELKQ